jgi:hypothetical protein
MSASRRTPQSRRSGDGAGELRAAQSRDWPAGRRGRGDAQEPGSGQGGSEEAVGGANRAEPGGGRAGDSDRDEAFPDQPPDRDMTEACPLADGPGRAAEERLGVDGRAGHRSGELPEVGQDGEAPGCGSFGRFGRPWQDRNARMGRGRLCRAWPAGLVAPGSRLPRDEAAGRRWGVCGRSSAHPAVPGDRPPTRRSPGD